LSTRPSFAENAVNATPQLRDAKIGLTDPDSGFGGGYLMATSLLAEGTVALLNARTVMPADAPTSADNP
jgi:hypothetical protein